MSPTPSIPTSDPSLSRVLAEPLPPAKRYVSVWGRILLGVFLTLLGALLVQNAYLSWPRSNAACDSGPPTTLATSQRAAAQRDTITADTVQARQQGGVPTVGLPLAEPNQDTTATGPGATNDACRAQLKFFWWNLPPFQNVNWNMRLLLIVILMGALGAWIHAAASFTTFAGNRTLVTSWMWWYVLRPVLGSALALVFYAVMRAGFITGAPESGNLFYGVAALSALVGLFSTRATQKLRDVFETLFGPKQADRDPHAGNPVPVVKHLLPDVIQRGSGQLVRLVGTGFLAESVVMVAGEEHEATVKDDGLIELLFEEKELVAESLEIVVRNPEPGGGESKAVTLAVKD